jgi:hypothetical protein
MHLHSKGESEMCGCAYAIMIDTIFNHIYADRYGMKEREWGREGEGGETNDM